MPPETQTARDRFEETLDALNNRDFDRFAATHADDVVLHDHDETHRGVEAAIDQERRLFEAFPDMRYDLESVVAEGDQVSARWTVTGTHEGTFQGIPPTGEEVAIQAMGIMTSGAEGFTEVWLVFDRLGLLEQLGAIEASTA